MRTILFFTLIVFAIGSCQTNQEHNKMPVNKSDSVINRKYEAKSQSTEIACKLTTPELEKRMATVVESIKQQVIEEKELENGYAYKFKGSDKMIDELTDFIKTERQCCDFFTFNLSVAGDESEIWFELTGPKEAKEFIKAEFER